jgi:putative ABC transport system substrate-binding protein
MIDAAARASGKIQVSSQPVRNIAEIEAAVASVANTPNGALIVIPGPLMAAHRELIASLAHKQRLPSVAGYRFYPGSGGLASYGADNIDLYRRAGSYLDRVVKGEKPGDLPVQMASKFELVINLKTAKALGLTIPASLLTTADEVIE